MPINGFEGLYEVSHFGRIKSLKRFHNPMDRYVAIYDGGVRMTISLWKNNKRFLFKVHHLVLENFNCEKPDGLECCHNNGDYRNNYIGNLRWDTHSANMQDAIKHGTFTRAFGEQSGRAKLKNADVVNIKESLRNGARGTRLAKLYNVSNQTIYNIKNDKIWQSVNAYVTT